MTTWFLLPHNDPPRQPGASLESDLSQDEGRQRVVGHQLDHLVSCLGAQLGCVEVREGSQRNQLPESSRVLMFILLGAREGTTVRLPGILLCAFTD